METGSWRYILPRLLGVLIPILLLIWAFGGLNRRPTINPAAFGRSAGFSSPSKR
jgi:hypothetical protein